MAKRSPKNFDVREWAKETICIQTAGSKTALCSKEILDAIHTVLEMKANGESQVSVAQLFRMLKEKFDYPYGKNALYEYIKRHESELWGKISGQK